MGWGNVGGHYGRGGAHLNNFHRQPGMLQGDHLVDIFSLESSPDRVPPYETRIFLTSFVPRDRVRFFLAIKTSVPFCQPKIKNSRAWLVKKIIMYSKISMV